MTTDVTLEVRVLAAQADTLLLNQLLEDYLPFLKKTINGVVSTLEYDDKLSLAMLAFVNFVRQYSEGKGSFLSFVQVSVRNRIFDEGRREKRHTEGQKTFSSDEEETLAMGETSLLAYQKSEEQRNLAEEITALSERLSPFQITMAELAKVCPKQTRARLLCVKLAHGILTDSTLKTQFLTQGRIPQAALSERFAVSPKTIAKHRKYIVTLTLLLEGDYPAIQAFLPQYQEEEVAR